MKSRGRVLLLAGLLLTAVAAALLVGPVMQVSATIIWQVRLPRVLLAIVVGVGLSGAGAVFQSVLRNPLADPFMLGTSSAAAAGVMISGILGVHRHVFLYPLALAFALLSVVLVHRIARTEGRSPIQTMILAGVIVSLFFNAAAFLCFSVFYRESFNAMFFLLGTLSEGDPLLIGVSGAIVGGGLGMAWYFARDLDILSQGEEAAFHLGVPVEQAKSILFTAASAMVAAAVASAGLIGFVGLVVPHMMRMAVGPRHRVLIPAAALGGAVFLTVADTLARVVVAPLEIPVGAVTAVVGTPYFVYLLRRQQRAGEF